ncbi:MAG: FHA domain-containing protein [Chloroflexi bacterium]|nr:FHA domain-containing protein [Chloroflexota bacterium]
MSGPVVLALRLLLAVSLYAFLGWAFISLWRDITQQGALLASRKVPPISLTIARGEPSPPARHFGQPAVTIGRDPACDCPGADAAISARHARLSFHNNQWWLEDLDSTNGTLLNQEKLAMPTVVISDDEFKCGETCFVISLASDILTPPTKRIPDA